MSLLTPRERELVALGSAMGSNCVPCIEYHIPAARKAGLTDSQISEAIRLADRVRQVPARKVLDTAHALLSERAATSVSDPEKGSEAAQAVSPEKPASAVAQPAPQQSLVAAQPHNSDKPCCG